MLGYPIRTSSDQRSVDNSPRHIAASHVLHRLPMPRHPPCALTHLHTTKKLHKTSHTPPPGGMRRFRCSQPLSTNQTPHPTTKRGDNSTTACCLRTQQCVWQPAPAIPNRHPICCAPSRRHYSHRPLHGRTPTTGMPSWCSLERR